MPDEQKPTAWRIEGAGIISSSGEVVAVVCTKSAQALIVAAPETAQQRDNLIREFDKLQDERDEFLHLFLLPYMKKPNEDDDDSYWEIGDIVTDSEPKAIELVTAIVNAKAEGRDT